MVGYFVMFDTGLFSSHIKVYCFETVQRQTDAKIRLFLLNILYEFIAKNNHRYVHRKTIFRQDMSSRAYYVLMSWL